jgi:acyl-coenzyme A thioesterase PaaI-like protein
MSEPVRRRDARHCFVCGPDNSLGLKVRFQLRDDGVCVGAFTPGEHHQGADGVTHGGILYCLLDDVMANLLWLRGERCVTARCEIRYRDALPIDTPIRLEGRLLNRRARLAEMEGKVIREGDGAVVAEASGRFMVSPS